MNRHRKEKRILIVLLGLLLLTAWLENPADYEPSKPGPNAPAYVNWRTGEWVNPQG
jgi:hypothetical protein